jgi:hypothetical protein
MEKIMTKMNYKSNHAAETSKCAQPELTNEEMALVVGGLGRLADWIRNTLYYHDPCNTGAPNYNIWCNSKGYY